VLFSQGMVDIAIYILRLDLKRRFFMKEKKSARSLL
jgi:hypothetical protein